MTTALITAIYGGYDIPKPLPEGHGFDRAICVTDNPDLKAQGWEVMHRYPYNMPPRLAAKHPRMRPWDFVEADLYVWLDASFQIVSDQFRGFTEAAVDGHDFATWEHPDRWHRNCLYKEAEFCQDWPKYRDYPIRAQTAHYRKEGMPEDFGLWATGTIIWRNNDRCKEFGLLWLEENNRWSIQDQVSFPYLVWKHKPNLGVFDGHEFNNEYLVWHNHTDGT